MLNYLPDDVYATVTKSVPIICVDLIPVRKNGGGKWEIGVITRATGSQAGKVALIGGRIGYDESVIDAVRRHLTTDCGIDKFMFLSCNEVNRPFSIEQYIHRKDAKNSTYDPTKHAISLTYLMEIDKVPKPKNEARDFLWIQNTGIPEMTAFNQNVVMRKAFEFLQNKA